MLKSYQAMYAALLRIFTREGSEVFVASRADNGTDPALASHEFQVLGGFG